MKDRRVVAVAGALTSEALSLAPAGAEVVLVGPERPPRPAAGVEFRECDLLSLSQVERAFEGVDRVIFVAGVSRPRARLVQGKRADFELLCADNVARAAARRGAGVVTVRASPGPWGRVAAGNLVQSAQRLPLPGGWEALDAALEYLDWLPSSSLGLLRGEGDRERRSFSLGPLPLPLLELTLDPRETSAGRAVLRVTGGLLAGPSRDARLEFRRVPGEPRVIAVVQDFVPALPWAIYSVTQAPTHLGVMLAFGLHLRRAQREPMHPLGAR
jgi:hypothetical protein